MKHTKTHLPIPAALAMLLLSAFAVTGCAHKQTTAAAASTPAPSAGAVTPHPLVPVLVPVPSHLLEVTPDTIAEEVRTKMPVLLLICTDKVGACRVQEPILEKVAADYQGQVKFLELDAMASDENEELSVKLGVKTRMDMPTFYYLKDGGVLMYYDGVLDEKELRERLDAGLNGKLKPHRAAPGDEHPNQGGDQASPVVPLRNPPARSL